MYSSSGLLQAQQQHWSLAGTSIYIGASQARVTLESGYFVWAKAGQHMCWSLISLVKNANFTATTKKPSVWLHKRLASLKQLMMQKLDMPESSVMDSLEYGCDNSVSLHQLPFVAASAAATLAFFSAWAFASPKHSGLKAANDNLSAACLLSGLLKIPLHAGLQGS